MPPDRRWDAAWVAALDDLELSLDEAELLLTGPAAEGDEPTATRPWSPPQIAAPLPAEMVERAQALLARQQLVILATADAMSGARRSSALLERVAGSRTTRRTETPVYLDVRA